MHKLVALFFEKFFRVVKFQISYSQEGEDLILRRIFGDQNTGFYVDIGAHHPRRFSNTYWAYLRGWRGICIDSNPGYSKSYKRERPRDIVLEVGISDSSKELTYFEFSDKALNTFSESRAEILKQSSDYSLISKRKVMCEKLESVLDAHLLTTMNKKIDFFSIDVEGYEFEVLKSNNFMKYRPTVIVIEIIGVNIENIENNEIKIYLEKLGYKLMVILYHSVFFSLNGLE